MGRNVTMAFLKTFVLALVVQVISSHNDRPCHLGRNNDPAEHTTAHRNVTSKWALLIDVIALNGLFRRLQKQKKAINVSDDPLTKRMAPDNVGQRIGTRRPEPLIARTLIPRPTLRNHLPLFLPILPTSDTAPCLRKDLSWRTSMVQVARTKTCSDYAATPSQRDDYKVSATRRSKCCDTRARGRPNAIQQKPIFRKIAGA